MVVLVGCLDAPDAAPTGPDQDSGHVAVASLIDRTALDEVTRWDSPWWDATDDDLTRAVAEADGRVVIGFEDPESDAGVDTRGRRLISPSGAQLGRQLLATHHVEIRMVYNIIPAVSAVIDPEIAPVLRAHPRIDYVEPRLTTFRLLSSDTMWAAEAIQAPLAWDSTTGAGVTVGVLDTGIRIDHPYLDPVRPAHDCVTTNEEGNDQHGHGTHVSGLIATTLSGGEMTGAAYGVALRSYRLGISDIEPENIDCGLQAAMDDGVDIVNMSFGSDTVLTDVADAIAIAYAEGMILVAAGGNPSDDKIRFPASMSQVIAVLGVDQQNILAASTPSGPWVELVAPGVAGEILTTCFTPSNCKPDVPPPRTGYPPCEICTGGYSSLAAPLVSAAAALLKSHEPGWTNDEIRARLRATALELGTSGPNHEFGYGLVQAYDALTYDLPPPPTVEIQGPDSIDPSATCTWNTSVTDGIAPFSYHWFVHSSSPVGSGPSYTGGEPGGNTGSDFNLYVVVTDHVGRTTEDEIIVELDESAPPCLI